MRSGHSLLGPDEKSLPLPDLVSRAYAAGVLDCDGSIWIARSKGRNRPTFALKVNVSNTRLPLIEWFEANYKGNRWTGKTREKKWKQLYRWECTGVAAKTLLETVTPFLVVKRRQALVALEFASTFGIRGELPDSVFELRKSLYEEMLQLNKRGPE